MWWGCRGERGVEMVIHPNITPFCMSPLLWAVTCLVSAGTDISVLLFFFFFNPHFPFFCIFKMFSVSLIPSIFFSSKNRQSQCQLQTRLAWYLSRLQPYIFPGDCEDTSYTYFVELVKTVLIYISPCACEDCSYICFVVLVKAIQLYMFPESALTLIYIQFRFTQPQPLSTKHTSSQGKVRRGTVMLCLHIHSSAVLAKPRPCLPDRACITYSFPSASVSIPFPPLFP